MRRGELEVREFRCATVFPADPVNAATVLRLHMRLDLDASAAAPPQGAEALRDVACGLVVGHGEVVGETVPGSGQVRTHTRADVVVGKQPPPSAGRHRSVDQHSRRKLSDDPSVGGAVEHRGVNRIEHHDTEREVISQLRNQTRCCRTRYDDVNCARHSRNP